MFCFKKSKYYFIKKHKEILCFGVLDNRLINFYWIVDEAWIFLSIAYNLSDF